MLLALLLSSKTNFLRTLIGGLLGFIGVTLVITGDTELSLNNKYVTGYVLAACCALIWSSYSWSLTRSKSNIDDVGWLSFAVALLSLIAHIQLEQTHWQLSTQQWLGVLLLGLGPVGGAFYLWEFGIKRGDKKLLASMSFAAPLISTLLLSLTGQGTWSPNLLFAVLLILLGAIVSNSNQKQASNNLPN